MYFPKNKIKTGLTSNGELVQKLTNIPYFGPYFETYKGKYYAGETPNYANLIELVPQEPSTRASIDSQNTDTIPTDLRFSSFENSNYSKQLKVEENSPLAQPPKYFQTQPTEQETQAGEYIRYFTKRTNGFIYLEISQKTYNRLKAEDPTLLWPLYDCLYIVYSLRSDEVNRRLVFNIERERGWFGFSSYLGLDT